jgi:hypothetical protein
MSKSRKSRIIIKKVIDKSKTKMSGQILIGLAIAVIIGTAGWCLSNVATCGFSNCVVSGGGIVSIFWAVGILLWDCFFRK